MLQSLYLHTSSVTLAQITGMKENCRDEHPPQNVIILFINTSHPLVINNLAKLDKLFHMNEKMFT